MHKKLMMACMAIAAFAAFVIAPAASASPVLTDPVGSPLAVGASVTGTNVGNTFFKGGIEVICSHAHIPGNVTANTGSTIAGSVAAGAAQFTGTGAGGECTTGSGGTALVTVNSALCFDTVAKTDTVSITGCGTNPVTFTLNITGLATCKYQKSTITGTFETSKDATINLAGAPAEKDEGGFLCPNEGTLTMDFVLTTTDGSTILLS